MTLNFSVKALATVALAAAIGCSSTPEPKTAKQTRFNAERISEFPIGGEAPVSLTQNAPANELPHFVKAVFLPGRGMNTFQISAMIPGRGLTDVIVAPPLREAAQIFQADDPFGNLSFKYGGALLAPFANRIRGKLSADHQTIRTQIAGQPVNLPANWKGNKKGAEPHAMHGLILGTRVDVTGMSHDDEQATVDGNLDAGDFNGHWPSKMNLKFHAVLKDNLVAIQVTAKNVGSERTPVGMGWHPYFNFPSGHREQARLTIPARDYALVNNYDDVFPTGKVKPVRGTAYDFSKGKALGKQYLDDCFLDVIREGGMPLTAEIVDPEAHYGLRIRAISPEVKAFQVYAPVDHSFVALEPQLNIGDPYGKEWRRKIDNGMIILNPGESVTYSVELELFTPN